MKWARISGLSEVSQMYLKKNDNRAKCKNVKARETNFALNKHEGINYWILQAHSDIEAFVTAEMVHNAYQGIGGEYKT